MKIHGKLKTGLAYIGGLAVFLILTAGFSGFDSIRLRTGVIEDSGGTTRIIMETGGVEVRVTGDMSMSGAVSKTAQPSFLVRNDTDFDNQTGNGEITGVDYDVEVYDLASNFNLTTNEFTAPVTGYYLLTANTQMSEVNSADVTAIEARITTSNRNYTHTISSGTTLIYDKVNITISAVVDMDANDTASVAITGTGGTKTMDIDGGNATTTTTYFSGSLLN